MNPMNITSSKLSHVNNDSNQRDRSVSGTNQVNDIDYRQEPLFKASTHYYFIYVTDENGNTSNSLCCLGLFIIIFQIILYYILIDAGFGDDYLTNNNVPVTTTINNCYYHEWVVENATLNATEINYLPDHLQCDTPTERSWSDHLSSAVLAMILVACFLQYDYLASISIILNEKSKWSKFAGLLVLIEALMATFCCSLFAFLGGINGSSYDAIMNTIGVLFVHDVDEKLFEALAVVDSNQLFKKCMCKCNKKYYKKIKNVFIKCSNVYIYKWNLSECWPRNAKVLITLVFTGCVIFIGAWFQQNVFQRVYYEAAQQAFQEWKDDDFN